MQGEKQQTAHGQQPHPPPGIDAPLERRGFVESGAPFAVETDSLGLDIVEATMLCAYVAVAPQCNGIGMDSDDAMEYIAAGSHLGQHRVAHADHAGTGEQSFIAAVLEEGTHAEAPQGQGNGVALIDEADDLGQQFGIGHLYGFHIIHN